MSTTTINGDIRRADSMLPVRSTTLSGDDKTQDCELVSTVSSGYHSESSNGVPYPLSMKEQMDDTVLSRDSSNSTHGNEADDVDDDDAGFDEEEFTLDFDAELDEGYSTHISDQGNILVYHEYAGEDFSQYLDEDVDDDCTPSTSVVSHPVQCINGTFKKNANLERKGKNGKTKMISKPTDNVNMAPRITQGNRSTSTLSKTSKSIKDKLNQVLTLRKTDAKKTRESFSSMQYFSYADSKLSQDTSKQPQALKSENTLPKLYKKRQNSVTELSTLSVPRGSDGTLAKRATSVPDLQCKNSSTDDQKSATWSKEHRKTKSDSLWRKMTRTLRRKGKVEYSIGDDQSEYEDIRL